MNSMSYEMTYSLEHFHPWYSSLEVQIMESHGYVKLILISKNKLIVFVALGTTNVYLALH